MWDLFSVTRLGDLLHFGYFSKPVATIIFTKSHPLNAIFLKLLKSFILLGKLFLGNFYRHLAIFTGHTGSIWSTNWIFFAPRRRGRRRSLRLILSIPASSETFLLTFLPFRLLAAVWPDLAIFHYFCKNFTSLWQIFEGLFLSWQNGEPTLANVWHYWANFHCCKCPNIET